MRLIVERFQRLEKCVIGKLSIDGEFFCYTLEDPEREEKIYGETAIPKGAYNVVLDHSPRFQTDLPRLINVPGFEGVRIHPGNKPEDTEGCILVGQTWGGEGFIAGSRRAFAALMKKLRAATDEITLEIV